MKLLSTFKNYFTDIKWRRIQSMVNPSVTPSLLLVCCGFAVGYIYFFIKGVTEDEKMPVQ